MSQEQTCVFAYTESTGQGYPGYLNVTDQGDHTTRINVRTRGQHGTVVAHIDLPDEQVDELLDHLISHRYLRQTKVKTT